MILMLNVASQTLLPTSMKRLPNVRYDVLYDLYRNEWYALHVFSF